MLGVQLPSPETRGLARLRDQGRGEGGRPHVDLPAGQMSNGCLGDIKSPKSN